ncbi:unnamed protein product [Sphagnum jensenii]|uniref:Uncharacterized protein n=1 Tax=Sphagnum jensenii TaxID=128206 RepID=A0ABP0VD03_9BRYO
MSSVDAKPQLLQATFFPSTKLQKEQPSATLNPQSEIRVPTRDAQGPTPRSSDIQKMDLKPGSDFPQDLERRSLEVAEPLSE